LPLLNPILEMQLSQITLEVLSEAPKTLPQAWHFSLTLPRFLSHRLWYSVVLLLSVLLELGG